MFKVPSGPIPPPESSAKRQRLQDNPSSSWTADSNDEAVFTRGNLEKVLRKLETQIQVNQDLRNKYQNDPIKYMESEADLVEECKELMRLSEQPNLYSHFVKKLKGHLVLGQLLAHPNTDVAICAINLINELTDDDVLMEKGQDKYNDGVQDLVNVLLADGCLMMILELLEKLDEEIEDDKQGIFNSLSILENLISINPDLDTAVFSLFAPWILTRLSKGKGFDSVRGYVAEVLAILMQNSGENRTKLADLGGVDSLLVILNYYKKRDPKDADETEMVENLFDIMCALVQDSELCTKFVEAEGIELLLLMIKERKMARMRAFKVLDHALFGKKETATVRFVTVGGLKSLFTAFMRKGSNKYSKAYSDFSQKEEDEHVVSIIYTLFMNLQHQEHSLNRLVFKFIEDDFEKLHSLLLRHLEYKQNLGSSEKEDYYERLDHGLFTVQMIDCIILFLVHLNPEIKERMPHFLEKLQEDFAMISYVVKEYCDNMDPEFEKERQLIASLVKFNKV